MAGKLLILRKELLTVLTPVYRNILIEYRLTCINEPDNCRGVGLALYQFFEVSKVMSSKLYDIVFIIGNEVSRFLLGSDYFLNLFNLFHWLLSWSRLLLYHWL